MSSFHEAYYQNIQEKCKFRTLIMIIDNIMIEQDHQGFDEEQILQQVIEKNFISLSHFSYQQQKPKPKLIIKKPLAIYSQIPLYLYHHYLQKMPATIENEHEGCLHKPHHSLIDNENKVHYKKMSLFFAKKMNNHFNKFNENLLLKSEMTIYLKGISSLKKTDMLKPFDIELSEEPKLQYGRALSFESRFQSGNLHSVFMSSKDSKTYFLFLQNDTNTHGYNQWFNFFIKPLKFENISEKEQKEKYRFIIVNITKEIVYKEGMKLFTCSQQEGWQCKTPYLFYKNKFIKETGQILSTLDFQYEFDVKNHKDGVYFSLSYPYPYSKLLSFLKSIKSQNEQKFVISEVGRTQIDNPLYSVNFQKRFYSSKGIQRSASLNESQARKLSFKNYNNYLQNKSIIIIARQHPCQTAGSFVCEHIIRQLINNEKYLPLLRQCNFFIFPMINPDGVIHGNSRTCIRGYDINRCWSKENMFLSKQVEIINSSIDKILQKYDVEFVLDLHSHSKQFGCFGYFPEKNQLNNMFNFLMKTHCNFYNYEKAKFGISHQKRPTFRGQMFHRNQIKRSITIETSFYGYESNQELHPFSQNDFVHISQSILNSFLELSNMSRQRKVNIITSIKSFQKKDDKKKSSINDELDSDSDPEGQYLTKEERNEINEKGIVPYFTERKEYKIQNQKESKTEKKGVTSFNRTEKYFNKRRKAEVKQGRKPIYTSFNINVRKQARYQTNQLLQSEKGVTKDESQKNLELLQKHKIRNQKGLKYQNCKLKMSTEYPTSYNIKIHLDRFKVVGSGHCQGLSTNKKCESSKQIKKYVTSSAKIREKEREKNWTRQYLSVQRISSAMNFYH